MFSKKRATKQRLPWRLLSWAINKAPRLGDCCATERVTFETSACYRRRYRRLLKALLR